LLALDGLIDAPLMQRVSPRATRYKLVVSPEGVTLVLPPRYKQSSALAFVKLHADWANKQWQRMETRLAQRMQYDIFDGLPGSTITYFGESLPWRVEYGHRRGVAELIEGELVFQLRNSEPEEDDPWQLKRLLKRWYQEEAARQAAPMVAHYSKLLKVKPTSVHFKDTQSRWGSCHPDGRVMFQWRLIIPPHWVMDYVVAHELTHLRHADHSPAFWKLLEKVAPHTPQAKAWLKQYGWSLHDLI
jgi:predicted metal-dependent hydrolase